VYYSTHPESSELGDPEGSEDKLWGYDRFGQNGKNPRGPMQNPENRKNRKNRKIASAQLM